MPTSNEKVHTIHAYSQADQALNVHDDVPNLAVSVPDNSTQQPNPQTATSQ
jgi:hypothetical protein